MKTNEKFESILRMAHAAARIAVKDRLAIYGEGATAASLGAQLKATNRWPDTAAGGRRA
jgi:hypothetical protein